MGLLCRTDSCSAGVHALPQRERTTDATAASGVGGKRSGNEAADVAATVSARGRVRANGDEGGADDDDGSNAGGGGSTEVLSHPALLRRVGEFTPAEPVALDKFFGLVHGASNKALVTAAPVIGRSQDGQFILTEVCE
jgi:hypothetical protein